MKIEVKNELILSHKTEALLMGIFEGDALTGNLKKIDDSLNNEITSLIKNKELKGDKDEKKVFRTYGKLPTKKVILIGLGKKEEFTLEKLRRAASSGAKTVRAGGTEHYSLALQSLPVSGASDADKAQAVVEGTILGLYEFNKYITQEKDKLKKITSVTLLEENNAKLRDTLAGFNKGKVLAENVCIIRDLTNEPAEKVTPSYLAEEAVKLAKSSKGKIKAKVFNKKDIEKMKMGGLLGVSRAGEEDPKLIVLEYDGGKEKPLVLIGKGITFDSGGLDLKPDKYMDEMRSDMAGAATVLCTIKAAYELGLRKHIIAVIPTCENMIGSRAYKPGDILTMHNGKTVQVNNTDAEGRLILADALSYAEKNFNAEAIIDIATLTGASIIALGYEITPFVTTNKDIRAALLSAASKTDETMWELPLFEDYKELMKGDVSDLRNTSKDDHGPGVITGAVFLSNFVEKTPWAHLDIGGAAWVPYDRNYKKKGATGTCLRTFIQMLEDWK